MDKKLIEEWDFTLNGNLDPNRFSNQSNKVVFWRCQAGHSWKKRIQSRFLYSSGCPTCNSLGIKFPKLAEELAPENELDAYQLSYGSGKKVIWRCSKGHTWKTTISSRTVGGYASKGTGCPYCSNKKVSSENNVLAIRPELEREWDYEKNTLRPEMVLAGSHMKIWWKCLHGHSYASVVKDRCYRGTGCGKCSAQTSRPEIRILAELEHIFGNLETRSRVDKVWVDVLLKSEKVAIEYDGQFYHANRLKQDRAKNQKLDALGYKVIRFREGALPLISKHDLRPSGVELRKSDLDKLVKLLRSIVDKRFQTALDEYLCLDSFSNETRFQELVATMPGAIFEQSLQALHPELIGEWDFDKNGALEPSKVFPGSSLKVNWICEKGHSWQAPITARTSGNGCPYCRGTYASDTNNLEFLYPDIASEWDFAANKGAHPKDFTAKSNKICFWVCSSNSDHKWSSQIVSRTYKKAGCPYCSGNSVGYGNDMASNYPDLLSEWHPDRNNGIKPYNYTVGSGFKAWWLCKKGHEWQASIFSRVNGSGCPYCAGKRTSKHESIGSKYPKLVKQLANKDAVDVFRISKGSHKKLKWKCSECGIEWAAEVRRRVGYAGNPPSGCPKCSKKNAYLNFDKKA